MVQQQLPSATFHFSTTLKRAQIMQTNGSVNDFFRDDHYYTLCTRHSFAPSPVREKREGVPGRPQLASGAVFPCNLTGEPIGLVTCLPWPSSSVCSGWGQQGWQGLSAVVLTLPSKAGAGINECSVLVSPAPRAFPRGQGSALVFGP